MGLMAAEYDLVPFGPAPCSTCYISWDHLGSTRMITGPSASSGAVSYHDYMPFATEIPAGYDARTSTWGATDDVNQKFTGKERDAEIGLDFFGARYFSGAQGRFTSPDPLPWLDWQRGSEDDLKKFAAWTANPQNLNMYVYVNNNPLNHTDPTGMNACGTKDDSTCNVTITITNRTTDANGKYNDQFTRVANQQDYNATGVVSVNGKQTGTFLVKTTPSDSSQYATLAAGTYSGTLTTHSGQLAIRLQPTSAIPTDGPNPSRGDGAWLATGILVHQAGINNLTGIGRNGRAVSEGCQVVCTSQYTAFEGATGMTARPPQGHFTVNVWTGENDIGTTKWGSELPY